MKTIQSNGSPDKTNNAPSEVAEISATDLTTNILRRFGITRCYKGLPYTSYAIALAIAEEHRLEAIVKEIYMETATYFKCPWTSVERDIRTVAKRAWQTDSELLCKMAGYPLTGVPAASEFIEIVSFYVVRTTIKAREKESH